MTAIPGWDGDLLPIAELFDPVEAALAGHGRVLVEAPPGAGKSTLLPLFLGRAATPDNRLVLIQPRRLAAAAVAQQLARRLGQRVGQRIGLRTRFDRQLSADTAIEVVTEGIFLRAVQRDPELTGIGSVLFDEFHERSWQADLGLAFALESQRDWRDQPLQLVVMSATLPGAALQQWLAAPLLQTSGRSYPVAITHAAPGRTQFETHVAAQVRAALVAGARKVLVFLSGWGAIQRVARALGGIDADLHLLHSSVERERQQAALQAPPAGRQAVVLATNIAETSLTIEGVDTVIDSGRVRRPRFDPGRGMDRLEEGWISQASAEQRAGRAGRLGPGRCIRLWDSERQRRLAPYDEPEIRVVDPAPVVLELAAWGGEPPLLDQPEPTRAAEARQGLRLLGALDEADRITPVGRDMVALGLHPRLARLMLEGRRQGQVAVAARIAALLSEGDFLGRDAGADLNARLQALRSDRLQGAGDASALQRVQRLARQLTKRGEAVAADTTDAIDATDATAALLLHAWPDRLARRREGETPRFLAVAGFEVTVAERDPLARADWLLVLDHDGDRRSAALRLGLAVDSNDARRFTRERVTSHDSCQWDAERGLIVAQRELRFGAVVLERQQLRADDEAAARVWIEQIRAHGLGWLQLGAGIEAWLARLRRVARQQPAEAWAQGFDEPALLASLETWLLPWLGDCRRLDELRRIDFGSLLRSRLSYADAQRLDALAPARYELPSGRAHPVDYSGEQPRLAARLPEFYGLDRHPAVAGAPLLLELLSPAGRPLQVTADLPAFWRGAYGEVRKEMKGRYPKHFWPEQPWCAPATTTTRRRMPGS